MHLHICIDISLCVLYSINFISCVYSNSMDITNDMCDHQVENTIDLKRNEISSCWENKTKQNKTSTKPQEPYFTI